MTANTLRLWIVIGTLLLLVGLTYRAPVVVAETQSAPPCDPIGATGSIVISRCVDEETGVVLYVNNIGFIVVAE